MKKLFAIGAVVLFGHIAGVSQVNAEDNTALEAETPTDELDGIYWSPMSS